MKTLVKLAIVGALSIGGGNLLLKNEQETTKLSTDEILNKKEILYKGYFDLFFKGNEIKQGLGDCYGVSIFVTALQGLNQYEELIRENIKYDSKNKDFYINIPLVLPENKQFLKTKTYKVNYDEAASFQLDIKGNIHSPVKSKSGFISNLSIGFNAIGLAYLKSITGKKHPDTLRLEGGVQENTLKVLLGPQAETKTYIKGTSLSQSQLMQDLITFEKNPGLFTIGFAVNVSYNKDNKTILDKYKEIKKVNEVNHGMGVKDIIIKKGFYLGDNTVNTNKIKIVVVDPNNTSKYIEVDFEKFYKIIGSYNITHIKKLKKIYDYSSQKIENRNSDNFNKSYGKNIDSLNAKIINNGEYNQELQNKRGDIIIKVKSYNHKKEIKGALKSYNQSTDFITKKVSEGIINLKIKVNGINLDINFKENEFPFQKTKTRGERYENKFYKLLGLETTEKIDEIDNFLYAEETINLIHFIQEFYIKKQNGIGKKPFLKSSGLVTLSGDLLINDNLGKTKRSIKTQILSYIPGFESTGGLTILEEISDLGFKTEKDEENFITFLDKLYEKEYNKRQIKLTKNIKYSPIISK